MQRNKSNMKKIKLPDIQLKALRIPPGWRVICNHFCDIDPGADIYIEGLPEGNVWELFIQDMLFLKHDHLNLTLDLGWVPEADPGGKYELTLIRNEDWDNPIAFYESSSKDDIASKIDAWLHISAINELSEVEVPYCVS
jgi:hypothetical protein